MVAVLDLLLGYPEPSCVWIGLLLVHGALHGIGHGGRIADAVEEAAANAAFEKVQLGVVRENEPGLRFWRKRGFVALRESQTERAQHLIIMEKRL